MITTRPSRLLFLQLINITYRIWIYRTGAWLDCIQSGWSNVQELPCFGDGQNVIPTIHVNDLAAYVTATNCSFSSPFCTVSAYCTWWTLTLRRLTVLHDNWNYRLGKLHIKREERNGRVREDRKECWLALDVGAMIFCCCSVSIVGVLMTWTCVFSFKFLLVLRQTDKPKRMNASNCLLYTSPSPRD